MSGVSNWLVIPAIIGLVAVGASWNLGKQIKVLDSHSAAVLDDGGVDTDRDKELD